MKILPLILLTLCATVNAQQYCFNHGRECYATFAESLKRAEGQRDTTTPEAELRTVTIDHTKLVLSHDNPLYKGSNYNGTVAYFLASDMPSKQQFGADAPSSEKLEYEEMTAFKLGEDGNPLLYAQFKGYLGTFIFAPYATVSEDGTELSPIEDTGNKIYRFVKYFEVK